MNAQLIKSTGRSSDFVCPHCKINLFFITADCTVYEDVEGDYKLTCPECEGAIPFHVQTTMEFTIGS